MQLLAAVSLDWGPSGDLLEPLGFHVALPDAEDPFLPSSPCNMTCLRRSIGDVLIDQVRPSWRRWARAWHDKALRVSNSWPQKSQRTVGGDCMSVEDTKRIHPNVDVHIQTNK